MNHAKRNQDGSYELPRHRWSWRNYAWDAYATYLSRSKHPILVGPWRGEIGFEALYWTPFINEFVHRYQIDPQRVIPISRGGAAAWYGLPSGFELYQMRTPQQVRVQNRADVMRTGMFKQVTIDKFDRDIVRDAAETLKVKRYHLLHPAWMYHTLAGFWTGHKGSEWIAPRLRFSPIPTPPLPEGVQLPEHFVAVKFYSRMTFPGNHKSVQKFLAPMMEQMTAEYDVVLLDPPQHLDDHTDVTRAFKHPRVHHLHDLMDITPDINLMAQSAVLGRAIGFVGTYGGFAQLALRMAKPSISFYLDWGNVTSVAHKALADQLSLKMGCPAVVIRIGEVGMLSSILPVVDMKMEPEKPLALQTA